MAGTLAVKGSRYHPRQLPAVLQTEQHQLDALLLEDPIPGPKPWSDEFERAAIVGCAYATPPQVSLRSLGVTSSNASDWLSDTPPEAYKGACFALRERLNKAVSWCERSLLARIARAGEEPSRWQANAWILERSKNFSHQYVAVQDLTAQGPSVVVNVGQMVINTDGKRQLPRFEPIVDVEAIQGHSEGETDPVQANPIQIPKDSIKV